MSAHPETVGLSTRRAAGVFAAGIAGLIGLAVARSALPAGTPRIRSTGRAARARSIAALQKVRIGGADQWVLQRSEDVRNPVVLFLHGGPGTSQLTSNRRNTRRLEKFFTVVNWDQRGAGKSYHAMADAEKVNIDQFVADTRELTLFLLEKFHQERLVLVGHSWGSVVGALTASKYPELYHCYVGVGQLVDMAAGESMSYEWTLDRAREAEDRKAITALLRIGRPYDGDWQAKTMTQRRYLGRFGGEVRASRTGAFGMVFRSLLFSREYTIADRINFFRGIFGSMRLLWPQLLAVDLFSSVPEIAVPVFFMEGRYDMECPAELADKYYFSLAAPSKELIWFEHSAHLPNSEERELFNAIMIEKVLPMAVAKWPG